MKVKSQNEVAQSCPTLSDPMGYSPLGPPSCISVWVSVAQSCLTFCHPMECSPSGSSVHGILQAKILEWVAIIYSRASSRPRAQTHISCIGRWILYHCLTWEPSGRVPDTIRACNKVPILGWGMEEGFSEQVTFKQYSEKKESEVAQSCLTLCNPMDCM